MSCLDDLPKRDDSHDTAEAAETAFRAAINTCRLFVVQQADRSDYGTDIQIEARDGEAMTNIRAHIQLKGTTSSTNANGSVSISVSRTNLNYLLAQLDSLYVCYHLPSKRLPVRYAHDVYREYEHQDVNWTRQDRVTVNFTQTFNEEFQRRLSARLLASGKASRNRRLQWIVTPPKQFPALVQRTNAAIKVPDDPDQAREVLAELYRTGNDMVISNTFEQFAAVLDSIPSAMDLAYMAEINLGINGSSFNKDRVTESIKVITATMQGGNVQPGSALYCLGNAWLVLGDHQKAEDAYRRALTRLDAPSLADVAAQCYKNLGSVLEQLDKSDEARSCYEEALNLAPDLGEARFAFALWHYRKGSDPRVALEHLDRVIRRGGSALQMSTVQGWRIDLLFNTGDANAAFREIYSLLGQETRPDWAWPWCANLVARFGKTSADAARKAVAFWRGYLNEHPGNDAAERERLLCLWRLRSVGDTVEMTFHEFQSAMVGLIERGDPDPAYLWDRIGHWAQYDKNWTQAERAYRKAYELEPARYGYCLGTALNFLRRCQEALPILISQAEKHLPDAMSWFQVAVAREGVGDLQGSISAYHRALGIDSDYALAWFNLGGMYWNSKDSKRAAETWREAVKRFPDHELAKKVRRDFPSLFEVDNDAEDA